MEPKETHKNIEELLSAAVDGEVSLEEHAQAEEALNSPEWASHAAFLSILRDSARFDDPIEMPASLSERIAQATYARPTLWSRITDALRPAPMRYAAGGLALSGLAAIGLVMLRPVTNDVQVPVPVASPNTGTKVAAVKPTPEPVIVPTPAATPKATAPTPSPTVPEAPIVPIAPDALAKPVRGINRRNDTTAPVVTPRVVAKRSTDKAEIELPPAPKASPAPVVHTDVKKPTPLPPPRLAEPLTGPVSVAEESMQPGTVTTGEVKGLTEGTPAIAPPRSVTIATAPPAAALRDPNEMNPQPKANPNAVVKISLNQSREKLNGLSAQAGVGGTSGSRISVVNDNEKR